MTYESNPAQSLSAAAAARHRRCCNESRASRPHHRCRRAVPAMAGRDALRRPSRRRRIVNRCVPAWRARLAQLPLLDPDSSFGSSRRGRDCCPSRKIRLVCHPRTKLQFGLQPQHLDASSSPCQPSPFSRTVRARPHRPSPSLFLQWARDECPPSDPVPDRRARAWSSLIARQR
jgi:hypothetical protein